MVASVIGLIKIDEVMLKSGVTSDDREMMISISLNKVLIKLMSGKFTKFLKIITYLLIILDIGPKIMGLDYFLIRKPKLGGDIILMVIISK